jgi:drug/metabolite transporter (DMT)-like permease
MNAPINRTMTAAEWGLLLFLSVLWGGSFFFNAIAVAAVPPFTVVAARVVIGAAFLYLALRATGGRLPTDGRSWRAFAVMGILNNVVPFSLIVWGQSHIASGLASILNATTPIFTVLVAHWLTHDERMTPARVAGVIIGFAGVVVMIGLDAVIHAGEDLIAELAVLGASVAYAFSVVYGRRFSRSGLQPLATATGQITASAVMMVPIALVIDQPWSLPAPGLPAIAALCGLGIIATALAYIIYYRILATAGSVNLMLVTLLIPVTAVLLGTVFLGERLSWNHAIGMAAIAAGLALIDGRVLRWARG